MSKPHHSLHRGQRCWGPDSGAGHPDHELEPQFIASSSTSPYPMSDPDSDGFRNFLACTDLPERIAAVSESQLRDIVAKLASTNIVFRQAISREVWTECKTIRDRFRPRSLEDVWDEHNAMRERFRSRSLDLSHSLAFSETRQPALCCNCRQIFNLRIPPSQENRQWVMGEDRCIYHPGSAFLPYLYIYKSYNLTI